MLWRNLSELVNDFLSGIVDETLLSLYCAESKRREMKTKFLHETLARELNSSNHLKSLLMFTISSIAWALLQLASRLGNVILKITFSKCLQQRSIVQKTGALSCSSSMDNGAVHKNNESLYLFAHLKKRLRGNHFQDKEALKVFVNDFLSSHGENFFRGAFDQLVTRWQTCKKNMGSYLHRKVNCFSFLALFPL